MSAPAGRRPVAEDELFFAESGGGEVDLAYYLSVLSRRRKLLFGGFFLAVLVAIALYFLTPKEYRATTVLQIERRAPTLAMAGVSVEMDALVDAQSFYPTQYRLLQSRGLAERVVLKLNLAEDPLFNPPRGRKSAEEVTAADDQRALASLATQLLANLEVKPIRETRLVEVSYVAPTPELAALVANGVAEAYIEWGLEKRSSTVGRASGFLAAQIEALKREIKDKELQLQAYSKRTDIVALDPNSNVTLQRLEGLNRDYIQAVSERIQKEARYKELLSSPDEAVADVVSGGLVGQLRAEQLKLEREYATKLNTFKPEWPAMQELQARIEKGRQHLASVIAETVANAREQAKAEYQAALRREQALSAELARQKAVAQQLNSVAIEYNNLKVEVSTRRALLDELLKKQAETEVSSRMESSRESNVTVVDAAIPPGTHFRPSLVRNLGIGSAVGLVLGLAVVFLAEYLDRRVKTTEDVERLLGLPLLATVPDLEDPTAPRQYGYRVSSQRPQPGQWRAAPESGDGRVPIELVPLHHPKLLVAEAYRSLRTTLLLAAPGGLHSLVVTSAVAGEGKTVTAANLAVVLAQLGRKVVLVDGDLRRSRQHQIFRVSNLLGLVHHLAGEVEAEKVLVPTDVPNLTLVPAGPQPPQPAELLSATQMADFLTYLQHRFDYVVVDAPPLLPVTDPAVLAAHCDGLLLCVGAGKVMREELRTAKQKLELLGVRVLGVVLNRFRATESHYGLYASSYYAAYSQYLAEEGQAHQASSASPGKARAQGASRRA
jgi:succinoglycan biosynthesis transport protein ExoP